MVLYNINLYKLIGTLFYIYHDNSSSLIFEKESFFVSTFCIKKTEQVEARNKVWVMLSSRLDMKFPIDELHSPQPLLQKYMHFPIHRSFSIRIFSTSPQQLQETWERFDFVRFKDQCCLCFPSWWEFWWPSSKSLIIYASTCFYNLSLISCLRTFHRGGMLFRREGILSRCKTRT